MSVKDLYASRGDWLKAEDLHGKAIKVVIVDTAIETIGEGEKAAQKIVLSFKNKEKRLVLNKTNADVIADIYGDEEGAWVDREIIIYPTVTDFGGKTVPCLRVRIESEVVDNSEVPF